MMGRIEDKKKRELTEELDTRNLRRFTTRETFEACEINRIIEAVKELQTAYPSKAVVICKYCGNYSALYTRCKHCGAPVSR